MKFERLLVKIRTWETRYISNILEIILNRFMINDKSIAEEGLIKSKEIGQEKYHVPFESILLTKIVIVNP